MPDRKSPSSSRQNAADPHPDSGLGGARDDVQWRGYDEDPLVELARIVSESSHTSSDDDVEAIESEAPGSAAARSREISVPEESLSGLEADLMAELAPIYSPERRDDPGVQHHPAQSRSAPQLTQPQQGQRQRNMATPRLPQQIAPSARASGDVPMNPAQRVAPAVATNADLDRELGLELDLDPLALANPQPDPVERSASYADEAALALETAVQDEMRLTSLHEGDLQTPPHEPSVAHVQPDEAYANGQGYAQDEIHVQETYDQGESYAHDDAYAQSDVRAQSDAHARIAPVFAQPHADYRIDAPQAYRHEVEPTVAVSPAREPHFDVDDTHWTAAEPAVHEHADTQHYAQGGGEDTFEDIFEQPQGVVPGTAPMGVLPDHPQAEKRAVPHDEPKRRGLLIAGAVAAVVVLGGGVFLVSGVLSSNAPGGPPVRIAAQAGPLKVFPDAKEAKSTGETPSKAIYARVNGTQSAKNEQLVVREEEPVANVATTIGESPRVISSSDEPFSGPATPRRVRTVVVRPDGTIISAPQGEGVSTSLPTVTQPDPTIASGPSGASDIRTVATTPVDSMPETPSNGFGANVEPRVPGTLETASEAVSGGETPASGDIVMLMPKPKPAQFASRISRTPAATPRVTSNEPMQRSGPLDLTGGRSAAAASAPAQASAQGQATSVPTRTASARGDSVPSGTYVVQVSSQRTREQAEQSYASMQRRYPSVLGNLSAVYPSVDLGDRGVYYRVRVAAQSREDAESICSSLKAAGGDCFVRRSE